MRDEIITDAVAMENEGSLTRTRMLWHGRMVRVTEAGAEVDGRLKYLNAVMEDSKGIL